MFKASQTDVLTFLVGRAEVQGWRDEREQTGDQCWTLFPLLLASQDHRLLDAADREATEEPDVKSLLREFGG